MYNTAIPEPPPEAFILPSGHWVEFMQPEDVTERSRRRFEEVMVGVKDNVPAMTRAAEEGRDNLSREEVISEIHADQLGAINSMADTSVAIVLKAWSFEAPIVEDSLLDLRPGDYMALQIATIEPFKACFLKTEVADPTDTTTPTTP